MPKYNKLVRDLIPDIIEQNGNKPKIRILNDSDYIIELKKKAFEELKEYTEAQNNEEAIEELADLLEIIQVLVKRHGSTMEELEEVRNTKAKQRGSFEDKIFLIELEEE
jgi:predicted house-cleaning noncanonical NTP pyrophosphatase (MazG superfamily)